MIEEENKRLSSKDALAEVSRKLKKVLNPTITEEEYTGNGIRLITNIESDNTDIISFSVKCIAERNDEKKLIYTIGYIYDLNTTPISCSASNLASEKIFSAGAIWVDNKLHVLLIPDSDLLKTEAEVFITDDNKNHVESIEYISDEDMQEYTESGILLPITGDLDVNFWYKIVTGEDPLDYVIIENGSVEETPIDTILHSIDTQKLDHNVEITINNNDSEQDIYGTGTLDTELTECDLNVTINTDNIVEQVLNEIELPEATDSNLGGIALAGNIDLGDSKAPLETTTINGLPRAYIDLSNVHIDVDTNADIHRFRVVPADNVEAKTNLFQYIGPTNNNYTFGYYYMWAPKTVDFTYQSAAWYETDHQTCQVKIARFNKLNDFILLSQYPLVIDLVSELSEGDSIIAETEFSVKQGNNYDATFTYEEIQNTFGFTLKTNPNYEIYSDEYDYGLSINVSFTEEVWQQKNVLPMMKVDSPLVYKGIVEAEEGETDIEALERCVEDPSQGDFYTVLPSKQEYFYTGSEWEYMGEIIDVNYVSQEAPGTLSVQVGGITNNTPVEDITNRPVSEVLDMILFPDIEPTLSGSQNFTFNTSQAKTVAYGSDVYATSVFSTSHSEQTVSYSKLNNTGSVLKNQTYQGAFTTSEITKSPNINKFTSNVTYYCTGTWANGDKYPCTKKGNTPASGSPSGAYVSQSSTKTITINVLKHCLYGVADTINATSIAQGTKLFRTSTGSFDITLDHPVGGRHFIAVPAVPGQNWTIGDRSIKLGVLDVTNSFTKETVQNVTVTNNGETYTMNMYVAYLTNPAAAMDSVTYNITIS